VPKAPWFQSPFQKIRTNSFAAAGGRKAKVRKQKDLQRLQIAVYQMEVLRSVNYNAELQAGNPGSLSLRKNGLYHEKKFALFVSLQEVEVDFVRL